MKIYISNLNNSVKDEELSQLFKKFGEVTSAEIAYDAFNGNSRGFAYVEMENETDALKAINELNNTEVNNEKITVEQAKPTEVHKGSYKVGSGAVNMYRFRKN